MKKQKKTYYDVNYYFDGNGICKIEANSPEEAEQKFRDGDFNDKDDNEWGENFFVEYVEITKTNL